MSPDKLSKLDPGIKRESTKNAATHMYEQMQNSLDKDQETKSLFA